MLTQAVTRAPPPAGLSVGNPGLVGKDGKNGKLPRLQWIQNVVLLGIRFTPVLSLPELSLPRKQ